MRRFFALFLVVSLLLQGTGEASTGQLAGSVLGPLRAMLASAGDQLRVAVQGSESFAIVTGSTDRFQSMHRGLPIFTRREDVIPGIAARDTPHVAAATVGRGTYISMPGEPLNPANLKPQLEPAGMRTGSRQGFLKVASLGRTNSVRRAQLVNQASANTTGMNPWWDYESGSIPGLGSWFVNAGTDNLIVQANDVNIPERGINFALRRTYNLQSGHTYANDDGSVPSNFGNRWTSNLDAHISFNAAGGISVFDVDGARYDYLSDGHGGYTPPPGQFASLAYDGGCGYLWTKRDGRAYDFSAPNYDSWCAGSPSYAGLDGRIYAIRERNHLTWLRFDYSWTGDASSAANLSSINVVHSDGHVLTLQFADSAGHRLLASVSGPGPTGTTITYASYLYDANANLTDVYTPGNDPSLATIHTQYFYSGTSNDLIKAAGSDWVASGYTKGSYVTFAPQSGNDTQVQYVTYHGTINPAPADGVVNSAVQAGYATGESQYRQIQFYYSPDDQEFDVTDSDGHASDEHFDDRGRVDDRVSYTGTLWVGASTFWDSNNEAIGTTDLRGNRTDFAYDTNGNLIAVAGPMAATSAGTFRPTTLYSYDPANNNLLAMCDAVSVGASGYDWVNLPKDDTLCSGRSSPKAHYSYYTGDVNEPYGRMTDAYTAVGYHSQFTYDSYGMPTLVQGDSILQADGTNMVPIQAFQYDGLGNLVAYTKLSSTIITTGPSRNAWVLAYDGANRIQTATDPDNHTSYTSYNPDGSIAATQTPAQHALGVSSSVTYDADGNILTTTAVVGGVYAAGGAPDLSSQAPVTTHKYYDGDDRLVEVMQPYDATNDAFNKAWITRYIYDLSQHSTVGSPINVGGSPVTAYGNLYKTQEYLPSSSGTLTATYAPAIAKQTPTTFYDIKGNGFDALDRAIQKYYYTALGAPAVETLEHDTDTYDDPSTGPGLLHQHCNAANQCSTLTYNALGQTTAISFNDSNTPNRTMTYDPVGRASQVSSTTFGTQSYTYDAGGNMLTSTEPTSGANGWTGATLTYHYYLNGMRKALDVYSSGLNQLSLFSYSYRADGKLQQQQVNLPSNALIGNTALAFTYSPAGRMVTRTESGAGANGAGVQLNYTSTGQLQQAIYPGGSYGSMEYDASGRVLGDQVAGATHPTTFAYTSRGEIAQGPTSGFSLSSQAYYANGTALTSSLHQSPSPGPVTWTWEPKMGVMLTSETGNSSSGSTTSFSFDVAGRNVAEEADSVSQGPNGDVESTMSASRIYDAENHIVSQAGGLSTNIAYRWGPNGHPFQIGSTGTGSSISYDSLHWDGDQLLFTTNSLGQVDDIKVGNIGDITPLDPSYTGLTFFDRDIGGAVGYCHNAAGVAGTGATDPYSRNTKFGQLRKSPCFSSHGLMPTSIQWWGDSLSMGAGSTIGQGGILGTPRTDGLADGLNTIQGARVYDSQLGGWTTPDAYAGSIVDPTSQKSYVWNGNNPVKYSDPTGYLIYDTLCCSTPFFTMNSQQTDTGSQVAKNNGASPPMAQMEGAVAGAYEDDRALIGEAQHVQGYDPRKVMTKPGTQTPKQLEETTAATLTGIGAKVKIDNNGSVVALHATFANGQVGTIVFGEKQVAISLTDAHGSYIPEATVLMRWMPDGGGHSTQWNSGYPVYRSILQGPNDWLPYNFQDDDFPKGGPGA